MSKVLARNLPHHSTADRLHCPTQPRLQHLSSSRMPSDGARSVTVGAFAYLVDKVLGCLGA
jgi:hypothetical protein